MKHSVAEAERSGVSDLPPLGRAQADLRPSRGPLPGPGPWNWTRPQPAGRWLVGFGEWDRWVDRWLGARVSVWVGFAVVGGPGFAGSAMVTGVWR
jgi:hypothetical protein